MKNLPETPRSLARSVARTGAVVTALMLAAGGCANMQAGVGPPTTVPAISDSAPKNTGTYPNLNIRPQTAAAQLTDQEESAAFSTLAANAATAEAGVATTTISPEEQERLRRLPDENLAEIEGRK